MKKRVSFDLFDSEDLDLPLPNVFPMKKRKTVSLSLFEDLLLHDQQPPLMPQPITMVPYSGKRIPQKKRKLKESIVQDEPEPHPEPLLPQILQEIGLNGGTVPIFLYQKRLTGSDSKSDQNRIFLSHNREKLMEFLTQVERQVVEVNQGSVKIVTIDPEGKYYTLHMRRWGTLKMVVLKKDWSKLVKANNLEEGDWIQLWGYRQNSQFHLAFNIKKAAKKVTHGDEASSSNVDGNGSSSCGGARGSSSGFGPSIVSEE
ncbi:unnamed protein product [Fraxinus pennsylvanica]|uniref:TF-B3 domain-containing protein n=1 Tax=Fraxinus pennsylvanica TaxID=56036 RepID=A0AAD2DXV5_9LAMI|nr:unnamed protein product [Fraxinus pennsylvanica]